MRELYFAYFGLSGLGQEDDLEGCKPRCPVGKQAPLDRSYLAADISLGVSVVSLAAATYFAVTQRGPTVASRGGLLRWDLTRDRLLVGGAF